jgi:carboxymethylenebutenolidase
VNDVQKYLVEEFVEEYQHHEMSRRDMLRRVGLVMGGIAGAAAAIRKAERALASAPAYEIRTGSRPGAISGGGRTGRGEATLPPLAQTTEFVVQPNDPAIRAEMVSFPGPAGDVRGYLARPAAAGAFPGVVVIHENRGLVEPNMDIARRYAREGYVALVPDLLSRVGGTDQFLSDLARASGAIAQLGPDAPAEDGNAAAAFLLTQPFVNGVMGATGFCFGGGVVWRMACRNPNLRAVAPHYGPNPPLDEATNIRAASLGIYAELDTRITGASNDLAAALTAAGTTWEFWVAPGANHGFFNNTGTVYNPDGAREAWVRTLTWFDRFLV